MAGIKRTPLGYDLRRLARGRQCFVRIPGVCNNNPETVVLCHDNLSGVGGMGMKAPDLCGAWACSSCHDVIDGRVSTGYDMDKVKLMFYQGMSRTLAEVSKEISVAKK